MICQTISPTRRLPTLARAAAAVLVLAGATWSVPALAAGEDAAVSEWLRKLDDASYRVREEAQSSLIAMGDPAAAAVAEALESGSPEVKARARVILAEIHRRSRQARTDAIRKRVLWHRPIEGGAAGPAVVSGGIAVVAGGGQKLYGIDLKTGRQAWVSEQAGLAGPLQAEGGKVFAMAGSGGRTLMAFEAGKGTVAWRREVPGTGAVHVTVAGGVVYAGGSRLLALDAARGETRWEAPLPKAVSARPALAGGVVYVAQVDGKVRALDLPSGRALWEHEISPAVAVTSLAAADGMLCAAGPAAVSALDVKDRKELWRFPLPAPARNLAGVIRIAGRQITAGGGVSLRMIDGLVYVGRGSSSLVHALVARTGKPKWTFAPGQTEGADGAGSDGVALGGGGGIQIVGAQGVRIVNGKVILPLGWAGAGSAWLAVAGGVVYCPAPDAVWAMDARTGRELWRLPTTGYPLAPAIAGGLLLFGTRAVSNVPAGVNGRIVFVGGRAAPGIVKKKIAPKSKSARPAPGLFALQLAPGQGQ